MLCLHLEPKLVSILAPIAFVYILGEGSRKNENIVAYFQASIISAGEKGWARIPPDTHSDDRGNGRNEGSHWLGLGRLILFHGDDCHGSGPTEPAAE